MWVTPRCVASPKVWWSRQGGAGKTGRQGHGRTVRSDGMKYFFFLHRNPAGQLPTVNAGVDANVHNQRQPPDRRHAPCIGDVRVPGGVDQRGRDVDGGRCPLAVTGPHPGSLRNCQKNIPRALPCCCPRRTGDRRHRTEWGIGNRHHHERRRSAPT